MSTKNKGCSPSRWILPACVSLFVLGSAACGSNNNSHPDAGMGTDAAVDCSTFYNYGDNTHCSMNPTTHVEIINACTNATAIPVKPVLPMLKSDCSLPPIQ